VTSKVALVIVFLQVKSLKKWDEKLRLAFRNTETVRQDRSLPLKVQGERCTAQLLVSSDQNAQRPLFALLATCHYDLIQAPSCFITRDEHRSQGAHWTVTYDAPFRANGSATLPEAAYWPCLEEGVFLP